MDATKDIETQEAAIVAAIDRLTIRDGETYRQAGQVLAGVKDLRRKIQDYFKPLKEAAHRAWKEICDREKKELERLIPYERILENRMLEYQAKEQARAKAEAERLLAEIKRQEEEKRLAAAIEAEKAGRREEAEQIIEKPIDLPKPKDLTPPVPKAPGLQVREIWDFEIETEAEIPREFLTPDTTKIRAYVQQHKEQARIPGVKIFKRQLMVARPR